MNASDLSTLPVGAKFTRLHFGRYGVYVVIAKRQGSIAVEVRSASGRMGELLNWERVIEVK